ncbi:MAG: RHS repeat domain-containing protein [Luteibaculaceae bacterium]
MVYQTQKYSSLTSLVNITDYYPFGKELRFYKGEPNEKFLSTQHERDRASNYDHRQARNSTSEFGVFLSVDPLADQFTAWTPYHYCLNNPVIFVDPDGEKPTIWIEGTGKTGHTFMTVGEGKNLTVYTYGRYLGGEKGKPSGNSLDPSGKGVMIILSGKEASRYLNNQIEKNKAKGYELNDVSDQAVSDYFEDLFCNGRELSSEEASEYDSKNDKYGSSRDARVIDEYKLLSNNCTTFCTNGAEKAGTGETFSTETRPLQKGRKPLKAKTPFSLMLYLENQIKNGGNNVNFTLELP